jgi:hypothetical protein
VRAVVGEDRVDAIGHRLDQTTEEVGSDPAGRLLVQLRKGQLRGTVVGDEEVKLAVLGADLGPRSAPGSMWKKPMGQLLKAFLGLSPSTSGRRLMWWRCRQRCSDDRVKSGIVACSA